MNVKSQLPYIIAGATGAIIASVMPLLLTTSQADTKLLPFQGRLTDAAGTAIADGAKVVEFKMYDAPTGGNVKWAGEVHKLSVNGGLVNTMLGSKASLGSVDFSTPCYLQITVDANTDNQITAADPPLLPRQSVTPAIYAALAGQMQYVIPASGGNPATAASKGWDAVFDNGRPDTGRIRGDLLTDRSVTPLKLAPANNSIFEGPSPGTAKTGTGPIPVAGLTVGLTSNGRPVIVGMRNSYVALASTGAGVGSAGFVTLLRNGTVVGRQRIALQPTGAATPGQQVFYYPASAFWFLDQPPAGAVSYSYTIEGESATSTVAVDNGMGMFVQEL